MAILTQQFPVITVWRDELVRQGPIGLLLQVSKHCSVMFLFSFRSSTSLRKTQPYDYNLRRRRGNVRPRKRTKSAPLRPSRAWPVASSTIPAPNGRDRIDGVELLAHVIH